MDIERELRAALRPQEPGPEFTAAVLRRVEKRASDAKRFSTWRIPVSLAASLALVFAGVRLIGYQQQQDQAAYVHQQLVQALAITSYELNQLQQKISPIDVQENGT